MQFLTKRHSGRLHAKREGRPGYYLGATGRHTLEAQFLNEN